MPPPSAAAANAVPPGTAEAAEVTPAKPGRKKKLILMALAALLLLALAGGAAVLVIKKRAAAAEARADGDTAAPESHAEKIDPRVVPTFVPLDTFTVNLADREAERYAQVGITLEVTDSKAGDQIRNYMPAIRNNILMVLADKTSQQLLEREGKQKLAAEILREAVRPLGYEIAAPAAAGSAARRTVQDDNPPPIRRVHFSNFIIQ